MSTPVGRRWRLALVAVALVGALFAMHGLTHHGEHLPSATSTSSAHVDHGPAAPMPEPQHDGPGAMTVCLAMLLGAAALWLAGVARRRLARPALLVARRVISAVPPPAGARGHGPPDRWALSVCRC